MYIINDTAVIFICNSVRNEMDNNICDTDTFYIMNMIVMSTKMCIETAIPF